MNEGPFALGCESGESHGYLPGRVIHADLEEKRKSRIESGDNCFIPPPCAFWCRICASIGALTLRCYLIQLTPGCMDHKDCGSWPGLSCTCLGRLVDWEGVGRRKPYW